MGFFSSIFGGQNQNLNTDIGTTGQAAGFGIGQGEKNISTASDFWNSIVGGDATKQTQFLAPEISAAKTSAQQDTKTGAEMGTRSGGTAASNAATKDKLHGYLASLIGNLTGSAVSGLASTGSSLLNTGLTATGMNEEFSQQRMANWSASILGRGITGAVQGAEALGMGAAGGALPGGPGAAAGAQGAFASFLNG